MALLIASAVAVAGCGSSGGTQSTNGTTTSSTTHARRPVKTEASKSPRRILRDAAAALRGAHGYVLRGTVSGNHHQLRFTLANRSQSSSELTLSTGGATESLIALPSASYIQANAKFWTVHGSRQAAHLADHWYNVTLPSQLSIPALLGALAPENLPSCLVEDHGKLRKAGRTRVDGHAAVLVRDAGNTPGSTPSTLAVALTGTPYPLRYRAFKGQSPGGSIVSCSDGTLTATGGTFTFGQFGRVARIKAPNHAQPLP